jgi:hypothetical protein
VTLLELIDLACMSRDGPVAYGWATVDLDRTLRELAEVLPFVSRPVDDQLLGARGRVVECPGRAVVVLEPSTEGRLARWLAHHGEGWAVTYLSGQPGIELIGTRRMTALGRMGVLDRAGSDELTVRLGDPFMRDDERYQRSRWTRSLRSTRPPFFGGAVSFASSAG